MKRRKKANPTRRVVRKRRPLVRRRTKPSVSPAETPAPPPAPDEEPPAFPPGWHRLTPMQQRVLQLLASGRGTNAIAAELGVSPNTVQAHRGHLCVRLGLRGRQALQKFVATHKAQLV